MGASDWRYFVPYQEDFSQALQDLRQQVFSTGDYWWYGDSEYLPPTLRSPRPARLEGLFEDEHAREAGTHSILDVLRVVDPDQPRNWYDQGTIIPATADEVRAATGTDRPTRADTADLDDKLPRARWVGRCAVLYDEHGNPTELTFWGHSGD
ncbi:hypothetical protein ACIBL3_46930 [Kribbella sp. NPDC050124]|uniref:hypothetical protein n=1 Tax=Kribbella sp. NPDC050124 TaxID=3364114 RepID=UPI0037BB8463